jgi:hypothetical protein
MVSAAFTANCCEIIELIKVSKCERLYFFNPIEQSGEVLIIGVKAGSIRAIFLTIARISSSAMAATGANYAIFT